MGYGGRGEAEHMDFICLCIRVPKCGSSSLNHALNAAFADRRTFFLPDTLHMDGQFSAFHDWRFRRAVRRALRGNYGDPRMAKALETIGAQARPGDLISGGHFDYVSVKAALPIPARIITILRDPVDRCVSEYNYARAGYLRRGFLQQIDSKAQAKIAARYSLVGYLDYLLERREAYGDLASRLLGWDGAEPLKAYFAANVFHAGVLEESADFAYGLSEKLGKPINFPWDNSTLVREADGADAEARRRIEQLYPRDIALYEHQLTEVRRPGRRAQAVTIAPKTNRPAPRPAAPGAVEDEAPPVFLHARRRGPIVRPIGPSSARATRDGT
jgi:hypothetical protein